MCRSLSALHKEVRPQSQQQFALMAEGPLEELRRLEQEVSAYVSQTLEGFEETESEVSVEAHAA